MRILAVVVLAASVGSAGAALRIAAPQDGAVVAPGRSVVVTVEVQGATYREVALIGEDPIGFSRRLSAAPYRFTVEIPAGTRPGRYQLTAVGLISPGKFDQSAPIAIDVESAERPDPMRVEPRSLIELRPGDRLKLRVIGKYADGSEGDITESSQTIYRSASPKVASVSKDGVITAIAPGSTQVFICGTLSVPVSVRAR